MAMVDDFHETRALLLPTIPGKKLQNSSIVSQCCRILAATFLSLLLPISFLLLARLSTARYFSSVASTHTLINHGCVFFITRSATTLLLTTIVSLVTVAAFLQCLFTATARTTPPASIIRRRLPLRAACILLFVVQLCLGLGIQATVDAEISGYTVGRLVLPRRLAFAFGLHETMHFWWRITVKPVVGDGGGGGRVEKAAMAVALANLWWRKLREEAEALVVLPWVVTELGMDGLTVTDVLGWLLYYLTAVIGLIGAVKSLLGMMKWIFTFGFRKR